MLVQIEAVSRFGHGSETATLGPWNSPEQPEYGIISELR
jgi:hypothetical protein